MRIAIDMDGVLYEYDSAARYMLRELRDCSGLMEESDNWDFIRRSVHPMDWEWLQTEAVKLGLYRYGHITTGAIIGMRELAVSHELVVVTHRPRAAVRDTIAWLAYVKLPLAGVHILSDGQPKSSVEADVLVDDKLENIKDWTDHGRQAILFDRRWNRGVTGVRRAKGWGGVIANVDNIQIRRANGFDSPSGPNSPDVRPGEGTGGDRGSLLEDAEAPYQRWRAKEASWSEGVVESRPRS